MTRKAVVTPSDCRWGADLFHCVTHDSSWFADDDQCDFALGLDLGDVPAGGDEK